MRVAIIDEVKGEGSGSEAMPANHLSEAGPELKIKILARKG
jgi:hypothetical protein